MGPPITLRARVVLPVSGPLVENGAVVVRAGRVVGVGTWREISKSAAGQVYDLGNTALLPGLVNAHCHLDYTAMAGFLPPTNFPNWVKGLLAHKAEWTYSDFAQSWLTGAHMLERTGTTTVADIEAVPELLPEVWQSTPLRVCTFLELTCVRSQRNYNAIATEAAQRVVSLKSPRGYIGLSPHALYSTVPALLERVAALSRKENWRITTHVSESPQEFEMYRKARGGMYDWLRRQRDMSDCGHCTPVRQISNCGLLGGNFIAAHANYLEPADIRLFADSGASVVHCPRSHSYFGYDPFPYEELANSGVNVCLGTDSLASVYRVYGNKPELSLFAEMGVFAAKNKVAPETILRMATINGARALGLEGRVGQISEGASADLIGIPLEGKIEEAHEAVVNNWQDVTVSMIDGQWVIAPQNGTSVV